MIREQEQYFTPPLLLLDILSIIISYGICTFLSLKIMAFGSRLFDVPLYPKIAYLEFPYYFNCYVHLLPLLFIVLFIFLYLLNCYRFLTIQKTVAILQRTAFSCLFSAVIFLAFMVIYYPLRADLCFILIFFPLVWILIIGNRICLPLFIRYEHGKGNFIRYLLIIGTNEKALGACRLFNAHPEWGIRVVGLLTDDKSEVGKKLCNCPVTGLITDLLAVLENNVVDCILFAGGIHNLQQLSSLALRCNIEGIDFAFDASTILENVGNTFVERLDTISLFVLKGVPHSPQKLFLKRLIDILLSVSLIILFLPIFIILPILIKRDSPGPVLFRQERVGKNGRRFIMYKFRSMVMDADKYQDDLLHLNEMDGPVFKITNDPRITRFGNFLRISSLDEFPQLLNVLKGEMSLVGPRPPIHAEVLQYRPWDKKRLSVTPGITCLWQVNGRNETTFDEWMKLDQQYIENWSLTLDFKILLRTLPAVFSRRGAR